MTFTVCIVTQDGDENLKVFASPEEAERRFRAAWLLLREDAEHPPPGECLNPEVVHRLRSFVQVESIERVEFHECQASAPRDAAQEVREGRSRLRHWRDFDEPLGEIIEELLADLDASE